MDQHSHRRSQSGGGCRPSGDCAGRVRVWPLAVLLVVAIALLLITLHPWSRPRAPQVLLVGIDGADWRPIRALLAAGELPNLAQLIQEGAHGPLWGVPPLTAPVGWTTVATGKGPDQHGVLDATLPDPRTGQPVVVMSGMRQSKTFWEIFADHGLPVGVVGWWATGPAEPIEGIVVSDRALRHALLADPPTAEGAVHPAERAAEFLARRDRVAAPSYRIMQRFMDVTEAEVDAARDDDPSDPVAALRRLYRGMRAAADIALHIQRRDRPDILVVYFEGVDTASHYFGAFADADDAPASGAGQPKFGRTLREVYRFQDELLGELLALTGEATTVIVASAYGFRPGAQPAAGAAWMSDPIAAARDHRAEGILLMKGPRIRHRASESDPAAVTDRATVFDIAPTLLALLNLPVPQDMEGRVLTEVLAEDFGEPSSISTYENEAWVQQRAAARPDYRGLDEPTRARLRSLGYFGIDDPSGVFSLQGRESLAEYFAARGDHEQAQQELEAVIAIAPQMPGPYVRLGLTHMAQKKFATARSWFEQALALDPRLVAARMNLAYTFRELREPLKAIATLEEGARLHPDHAGLRVNLGMLYKEINDLPGATRLFEEALRISPDHQPAHAQLALMLERRGDLEGALAHWQEALRLRPGDRLAREHVTLVEQRLGRAPSQIDAPATSGGQEG